MIIPTSKQAWDDWDDLGVIIPFSKIIPTEISLKLTLSNPFLTFVNKKNAMRPFRDGSGMMMIAVVVVAVAVAVVTAVTVTADVARRQSAG